MSVLVSWTQWSIAIFFLVTMSESRNLYNEVNTSQKVLLSQLQRYLSLIQFDTRESCMKVLCAPKKSKKLDQWLAFNARGNLLPMQSPVISPYLRSGQHAAFNDLRNALRSGSHIIMDGQNNAIGVTAESDGSGNNYISENPSSVYPYVPPIPVERNNGSKGGDYPLFIPSALPPPVTNKPLRPSNSLAENTNICCSTVESYFINSTLVDVTGTTRTIAQMKHIGTYQIIRHGFCGIRGVCPGICDQVFVILPLAIYPNDPGQTVSYRYFQIPGYCSCKVPA